MSMDEIMETLTHAPTIEEITSLLEMRANGKTRYIDPVFNPRQSICWSTDYYLNPYTYMEVLEFYVVDFKSGRITNVSSSHGDHNETRPEPVFVRAVRSIK